jgi:hypothetical protein
MRLAADDDVAAELYPLQLEQISLHRSASAESAEGPVRSHDSVTRDHQRQRVVRHGLPDRARRLGLTGHPGQPTVAADLTIRNETGGKENTPAERRMAPEIDAVASEVDGPALEVAAEVLGEIQ